MKVQLTTDRIGPRFHQSAGEVLDLPDAEAESLVAGGQAIVAPDADALSPLEDGSTSTASYARLQPTSARPASAASPKKKGGRRARPVQSH